MRLKKKIIFNFISNLIHFTVQTGREQEERNVRAEFCSKQWHDDEVMICPKILMDKQALSPSKAPERTNKYLLCVVLGRHDNEGKVSLAHENHSDNSLLSYEQSYRADLSKTPIQQSYIPLNCRTGSFIGVLSLFILDVYDIMFIQ